MLCCHCYDSVTDADALNNHPSSRPKSLSLPDLVACPESDPLWNRSVLLRLFRQDPLDFKGLLGRLQHHIERQGLYEVLLRLQADASDSCSVTDPAAACSVHDFLARFEASERCPHTVRKNAM